MACGTPIVIGDIGGAREALRSHTAGRIAAFEPQAVADAVCDVLHEAPDPQAVRREVDRFSWKANAEALEAHLRRVAAGA
jgi:glycosyltransferase involved in cell wall biosynthesis